ncbi:MAG: DUF2059 domain-containing protein, partial [Planctomycetota bacterium]
MRHCAIAIAICSALNVASGLNCHAQDTAAVHQRLGRISTQSLRPDRILTTLLKDLRIDPSVKQDLASDAALLLGTNWTTAEAKLAELYKQDFSEAELEQLEQFFRSPVGKKFLAKQQIFASELLLHAMLAQKVQKAKRALDSAFDDALKDAIPTAKAAVQKALDTKSPDRELLLGSWYTKDLMDPEIAFYGKQSKSSDGMNLSAGVFIDHAEKT